MPGVPQVRGASTGAPEMQPCRQERTTGCQLGRGGGRDASDPRASVYRVAPDDPALKPRLTPDCFPPAASRGPQDRGEAPRHDQAAGAVLGRCRAPVCPPRAARSEARVEGGPGAGGLRARRNQGHNCGVPAQPRHIVASRRRRGRFESITCARPNGPAVADAACVRRPRPDGPRWVPRYYYYGPEDVFL